MKQFTNHFRAIFATAMMLCVALPTLAHDFEVDGIYYNYLDESAKTVAVTYWGSYSSSYHNEYSGSVIIPSSITYNGTSYSVTSIGEEAFSGCTGLTEVTIPNSVTMIGNYAFASCQGLTSVTIPNSVTEIGGGAFKNCQGLTSVTIPNSVTKIGEYAFYDCTGLTSVTIPNSVTEIGSSAFSRCTGLTEVTIPNSVTSIGSSAFSRCSGLTSVTIPNSVTSIGSSAFYDCTGLTKVTIPNSVTEIGGSAFSSCTGLTSVTIPNSVTSIGSSAFYYCSGLTSVTIGNSVTSIGDSAFSYCSGLTSVTIGNSVTEIGNYAFSGCSSLKNIISLNPTPPSCESSSSFNSSNYSNATLYVPKDGFAKYFIDDVWGQFSNIKKIETLVSNTRITLSQAEASLPVNEIITLTYTVTPSYTPVEWSTSNPNVAYIKVNSDNSVTVLGLTDGVATITASATDGSGASASCVVTVGVGGVEGIEADDNAIEVARYDIHGRLLSEPTRGINIVKYNNGTTKKEVVK